MIALPVAHGAGGVACLLATAVLLTVGCADGTSGPQAPRATVRCDAVEYPPLQGGAHLIGDRPPPVDYSSTPPTSGWHVSGALDIAAHFAGRTLTGPEQVSLLEEGAVVVTFNALPDDELRTLEHLTETRYADRVGLTTYRALAPGQVAFTAWGAVQRCDGLDAEALDAFVATFADRSR